MLFHLNNTQKRHRNTKQIKTPCNYVGFVSMCLVDRIICLVVSVLIQRLVCKPAEDKLNTQSQNIIWAQILPPNQLHTSYVTNSPSPVLQGNVTIAMFIHAQQKHSSVATLRALVMFRCQYYHLYLCGWIISGQINIYVCMLCVFFLFF